MALGNVFALVCLLALSPSGRHERTAVHGVSATAIEDSEVSLKAEISNHDADEGISEMGLIKRHRN